MSTVPLPAKPTFWPLTSMRAVPLNNVNVNGAVSGWRSRTIYFQTSVNMPDG